MTLKETPSGVQHRWALLQIHARTGSYPRGMYSLCYIHHVIHPTWALHMVPLYSMGRAPAWMDMPSDSPTVHHTRLCPTLWPLTTMVLTRGQWTWLPRASGVVSTVTVKCIKVKRKIYKKGCPYRGVRNLYVIKVFFLYFLYYLICIMF